MISVIIPAYNAENVITSCLLSLQKQSLDNKCFEVLVVDDGSTDRTIQKTQSMGVRVICQSNSGPASARNRGAIEASGEILVFTDADCELERDFLQNICRPIQENSNIAGVQGRYLTKQKEIIARFAQYEIEERYQIYEKKSYIRMIGTYAAAYRKDVFLDNGMFDTSFPIASGEDFAFSGKLASQGYKMIFVPEAICYHQHPDTLSGYFKQKYFRAYWRNLLYKNNSNIMIKDDYTPQMLKLQVGLTLLIPVFLLAVMCFFICGVVTGAFYVLLIWILIFLITTVPLVKVIGKKSISLSFLTPFFVLLRATALAYGLLSGFIDQFQASREKIWV